MRINVGTTTTILVIKLTNKNYATGTVLRMCDNCIIVTSE